MRRTICLSLAAVLLAGVVAPARATVSVSRRSDENPMVEVARSVLWGAVAGAVVGAAVALADKSPDNGTPLRYGIVAGTFTGLGYGLWWSAHRPSGAAMLQIERGGLHARALPPIELAWPTGAPQARIRVIGITF